MKMKKQEFDIEKMATTTNDNHGAAGVTSVESRESLNMKEPSMQSEMCSCMTTEQVDQMIQNRMSEMFQEQFENLKDELVSVMASKMSTLIEENNVLRLEIHQLREKQEADKKELSVVHQLVNAFNSKQSDIEEKLDEAVQEINGEVQSINDNVSTMLNEVPQITSIEDRFSSIEEMISSFAEPKESTTRINSTSQSESNINLYSHHELMLEVTNEIDQRRKRRKNLVLHNVEESEDATQDFEKVRDILQEAINDKSLVDHNLTKAYRLGKQPSPGRNRTIKIHTKCEDFCHSILQNSRNLSTSKYYSNIVVQSDLTPLQRHHLKSLVHEKRERNLRATQCNEEPDWVIKNGRLSRKCDI